MKNLFYLGVALLCFTTEIAAQTALPALEGTWQIEAVEASGIYYELPTGKITLTSVDTAQQVAPEDLEMLASAMKEQLLPYYANFIKFDKGNFFINYGGKTGDGTYKISEREGIIYLELTYSTGLVKEIPITVIGNLLYLDKGNGGKMIYKLA